LFIIPIDNTNRLKTSNLLSIGRVGVGLDI
jgi:hypothetical protein